jgi:integrase
VGSTTTLLASHSIDRARDLLQVRRFSMYELRHTFAARLSAGGVADHFVTQMLRQGDAAVKRYSQAKLNMMRAPAKLARQANEHAGTFTTVQVN